MTPQNQPILKASIGKTSFKCGKPSCRCIDGPPHTAFYLSYRKDGKTHTVHIPKTLVKTITDGCRHWKRMLKNIEQSTHNRIQALLKSYHQNKKAGK